MFEKIRIFQIFLKRQKCVVFNLNNLYFTKYSILNSRYKWYNIYVKYSIKYTASTLLLLWNEKSAYIVFFPHNNHQFIHLYFSVFQLVSTNCFSIF